MEPAPRITSPESLEHLDPSEYARRLRPLIRRAQIGSSPEARRRHEENLGAALWILAEKWRTDPLIDGRAVAFDEFVAARLRRTLIDLYREQYPDDYDADGRYDQDGTPVRLDIVEEPMSPEPPTAVSLESIKQHLEQLGIPAASQLGALRFVAGVDAGSVVNGRQAAKALGHLDYKTRPATAALFAADIDIAPTVAPRNPDDFEVVLDPRDIL